MYRGSKLLHILATIISVIFVTAIIGGMKWYLIVIWVCIFLKSSHLFKIRGAGEEIILCSPLKKLEQYVSQQVKLSLVAIERACYDKVWSGGLKKAEGKQGQSDWTQITCILTCLLCTPLPVVPFGPRLWAPPEGKKGGICSQDVSSWPVTPQESGLLEFPTSARDKLEGSAPPAELT